MRFHAILGIIVLAVASFKNDIRQLCWEEYTKNKLCFPKYEKCLISGKEMIGCRDSFQICVKTGPIYKHTEFCNKQLLNLTIPHSITGNEWHQTYLDDSLNHLGSLKPLQSQKQDNCDLHNLLFKTMKPKTTSYLIKRMPILASMYCPCWEKSDDWEPIRESKEKISLQMWHGGFSTKKCWRELDRFLVEHLCGISTAMKINHIWAKSADCHEAPNHNSDCRTSFDQSLKDVVANSILHVGCKEYFGIIDAYLPSKQSPYFEYKITYINTTDLTYLQPYEYRDDRLYLLNSFEENTYFTCFSVKREVSSCNYMFEHCKTNEKLEECGEKLIKCLKEISSTSSECKNRLVQTNDNMWTFKKIYRFVMDNKLQLAWPIILYVIWTLTKSVINWLILSIAVKICLKISEVLDRWANSIIERTEELRAMPQNDPTELESVSSTTIIMITVPDGFDDIPLDTEYQNAGFINNNNNNNDNNGNEIPMDDEDDKKEEKEKEDYNFGQSFRKMIFSFGRLIRSVYQFVEIFIRKLM